ncbi:MAG: glycoside hydrolase family 3 protein [Gilliamella sp.]|uniref:glycoside hydrolase family 3 protein n=1 Tax=Gilliamella sp. TaxID=1891236 RepID=UPI0025EECD4D|nr:glycoside hydrolase family 3 N-terminal domain-containing protein [Gilliamella sp.]MCO6544867.1 glycoside hydrolase family 3 protein [Gilliamella sp.]
MERNILKPVLLISAILTTSPLFAIDQVKLESYQLKKILVDNLEFKDMDKDGKLTPYEDWRLSPQQRAQDLLSRMSLEEKAGVMMHGNAPSLNNEIGRGDKYDFEKLTTLILNDKVNSFITRLEVNPKDLAEQNNQLQKIAESSRLAIPLTISVDPRNTFYYGNELGIKSGFSQWPGTLGMAAIGSEKDINKYGDIIRQEYRALGVTQALSPMADLATEPRWARFEGTFGENPELSKKMVRGYISGIQGVGGLNSRSVAAVVKHWVGYGAAENGFDSHSAYGKYALFTQKDSLKEHIIPFTGAFEANVAGVMPTYSILKNAELNNHKLDAVGGGFNSFLLKDLLRDTYKFKGVIMSDWNITNDCNEVCINGTPQGVKPKVEGMPWGVENLTKEHRFIKAIQAGVQQFGGVSDSSIIVTAVNNKKIDEKYIDKAVLAILIQKFSLGQFENSYVDPSKTSFVGNRHFQKVANQAQYNSLVLLENKQKILPLNFNNKIYLHGFLPDTRNLLKNKVNIVDKLEQADVIVVRINAPYEQNHKGYFFGLEHHEGSLAFQPNDKNIEFIEYASKTHPIIVTIYLDRPAILTPLKQYSSAIIANFGVNDGVLFDRLFDKKPYVAKMPFSLPDSMDSVKQQYSDLPNDMKTLYQLGYGLTD